MKVVNLIKIHYKCYSETHPVQLIHANKNVKKGADHIEAQW
jgi:hypothetical protein